MKKIIMAAAIVCAATFAHAAAMTWGITNVAATPDGTAATAGWVAYFMDGSTYDAFSALDSSKIADFAVKNNTYSGVTTAARSVNVNATTDADAYAANSSVTGYMVIFNSGDASSATYYAATSNQTVDVPSAGNLTYAVQFSKTTGWQKIEAATPPPVTPDVPEPTSGLLLVLGGAALALRRRR